MLRACADEWADSNAASKKTCEENRAAIFLHTFAERASQAGVLEITAGQKKRRVLRVDFANCIGLARRKLPKLHAHGRCQVAHAEHADERASLFHAHRAYACRERAKPCKSAVFVEKCSAARPAPIPRQAVSVRSEAERLRGEAYLDQEGTERAGETDHCGHEQDGYGSRQVHHNEGAREKEHHHQ